ncbi:MAG: hypothetical protein ABI852_08100, partial [Gemmatimonadaceae bacterium]
MTDDRETQGRDGEDAHASPSADALGVTRRELLARAATVAGAALVGGAITGTPARLLAATDEWRVDLAPPPAPDQQRMLGVPFEKHAVVRIAI